MKNKLDEIIKEEPYREDGQTIETLLSQPRAMKRWSRILLSLLVLAGLGLGGYIFILSRPKMGRLAIYSEPPGARIYLDGKEIGRTPKHIPQLASGQYTLKLSLNGFEEYGTIIQVLPNQSKEVRATLINIQPPKMMEPTTMEVASLNASIIKEDINIEKERISRPLNMAMVKKPVNVVMVKAPIPKSGGLKISSVPQGARIFMDGKRMGTTPKEISGLRVGRYKVVLKMSGYCDWSSTIEVKEGRFTNIDAQLEHIRGKIVVNSTPSGAKVFVDGQLMGETPIEIKDVKPWKPHRIEVVMPGYNEWRSTVFTDPGETTTIQAILERAITTHLYVTSIPPEANLYIDGNLVGKTPIRGMEIRLGEHTLRIEKEGFLPVEKRIVAVEGRANFVNFILER